MKIKKIEIQGFKSFAEKQVLELNPHTNVIVGPNGSGKSNLIDAVNWVLGEQSARSLRGERMEDVIFSGSTTRRPVGMAQVVLHIDNSQGEVPLDYHEFTVTRRLFRSGESQFLINKIPCRLKDIRELFMGTGSGKGSLSIMSQGQVDQVLDAKPSYRREVFEEAAGISKYKTRCREARKQLSQLDQDSEILSGMAVEIENNLNALRHEAGKAQKYLKLRRERNELETLFYTKRGKILYREAAANLWKNNSLSLSLEKAQMHKEHYEMLIQGPAEKLKLKRADKEETSREVVRLQLEKDHLVDKIKIAREKKSWLDGRVKESRSSLDKSSQEIQELEERHSREQENSQKLLEEIQECGGGYESIGKKEKELAAALILAEEKAKRSSATYVEVLRDQAANSNLLSAAEKEIDVNDSEAGKIAAKLDEVQNNRSELKREVDAGLETRSQIQQQLQNLQNEKAVDEADIRRLQQKLDQVNGDLQENRDQHGDLVSRRRVLEEMHSRYEGYAFPVRELLKHGEELSGVCGVVGDLFEVSETYRIAIEVALGAKINNIVTETTQGAKEAISFLKERNSGRLTFLPLDVLNPGTTPREFRSLQEGVVAASVVQVEDKYAAVAANLLGKILIVKDLDTGLSVAGKTGHRFTIVTLQGEKLHPGGALTGGSLKKTVGAIVGRKKTIEELGEKIAQLAGNIAVINREKAALENELEQKREKLRLTGDAITNASLQIKELDTGRTYAENQIVSLERELRILREEHSGLEREQEENRKGFERLTARKEFLEGRISKVAKVADLREKRLGTLRQEVEACGTARKNAEIKLSSLEQKHQYALQTLEQIHGLRADMATRYQERTLEYEQSNSDALKLESEVRVIEQEIEANQERLSCLLEEQQELEQAVAALELQEQDYSAVVGRLSAYLQPLSQEQAEVKQRLAELRLEINSFEQELEEKKGIVLLRVCPQKVQVKALQASVTSMRHKMHQLEPVNLSSIEEYSRIEREREGLAEKVDDIKKAKGHLEQLVQLVERRMRSQFRDFFSRLQVTFNDTYLRVFGGGSAKLEIEDGDILEGTIDITVQPPGKRAQSLLLLSGGERALTALTLLFSIVQENHSPFCILDEVDTSLDESNIGHFTNLLEYYSQLTQFIVVSHRQGTMEAADNLFGVTMPEDGISVVVSVNLKQAAG